MPGDEVHDGVLASTAAQGRNPVSVMEVATTSTAAETASVGPQEQSGIVWVLLLFTLALASAAAAGGASWGRGAFRGPPRGAARAAARAVRATQLRRPYTNEPPGRAHDISILELIRWGASL